MTGDTVSKMSLQKADKSSHTTSKSGERIKNNEDTEKIVEAPKYSMNEGKRGKKDDIMSDQEFESCVMPDFQEWFGAYKEFFEESSVCFEYHWTVFNNNNNQENMEDLEVWYKKLKTHY